MSIYQIRQNPEFCKDGSNAKPFHLYVRDNTKYKYAGRRNVMGLHELKGHDVEIGQGTFGERSSLLEEAIRRLKQLGIEAKFV